MSNRPTQNIKKIIIIGAYVHLGYHMLNAVYSVAMTSPFKYVDLLNKQAMTKPYNTQTET